MYVYILKISSAVEAAPVLLKNYSEIVTALKHGQNVRAVVTLDNCKLSDSKSNDGSKNNLNGGLIGAHVLQGTLS